MRLHVSGRSAVFAVALALAVALAVALAGCTPDGPDTGTKTFIVAGTVRLTGQSGFTVGQPCTGTGDYADLHDGAEVVVSGPDGERLGVGQLNAGTGTAEGDAVWCVWTFFVVDVSAEPDAYDVEVTDRGRHRFDVSGIHGRVDLSIPG